MRTISSNSGKKKKQVNHVLLFEGGIDMMWNGNERSFQDSFQVQVDKKYLYFGDKGNWTIKLQELNVLPLEQFLENDDNEDSVLFSNVDESKQFICHYHHPPSQDHHRSNRLRRHDNRRQHRLNEEESREAVTTFLETVVQRCHRRAGSSPAATPINGTAAVVSPRDFTSSTTKSRYRKSYGSKRKVTRTLEQDFQLSDHDEVDDPPSSPLSSSPKKNTKLVRVGKRLKKQPSPQSDEEEKEEEEELFPTASTPLQSTASHCSIAVTDEEDHPTADSPIAAVVPPKPITSFFTSTPKPTTPIRKSTRIPAVLKQVFNPKSPPTRTAAAKSKDDAPPNSPKTNSTDNSPSPKIVLPDTRCTPVKKSSPLSSKLVQSPLIKSPPSVKSSPSVKSTPTSAKRGLQKFFTPNNSTNQDTEKEKRKTVKLKPPIGFRNLGNTCYLNSSLQILFSTKGFMDELHHLYTQTWNLSNSHSKLPLTSALLTIAKAAGVLSEISSNSSVDPTQLKQAMDQTTDKFQGYEQRDAHEFISDLIDILHEELVEYSKKNNNSNHNTTPTEEKQDADQTSLPTDKYFYLNIKVCLTCDSCGYTRCKQEMYRHLSIDVGDNPEEKWTAEKGLQHFFQPEKLDIRCEECKSGLSATQTMEMTSCPNVLLLHLKRFIFSESTFRKNKKRVVLPPKLQINSFCSTSENNPSFQLGGVVHHIGSSSSSGHYTTDAVRSEQWATFDDHNTKFTSLSQVLTDERKQQNSYLILYQQQR